MLEPTQPLNSTLRSRPDFSRLLYTGSVTAEELLSHFQITWEQIEIIQKRYSRPIADVGCGFSPFAVQAHLRGIAVTPIDIMQPFWGSLLTGEYRENVLKELQASRDPLVRYGDPEEVRSALDQISLRFMARDLVDLGEPPQAFAMMLLHDVVPKHAVSLDDFASRQLPALLRATAGSLYIYPFGMYEIDGSLLRERRTFQDEPTTLERFGQIALDNGFRLSISREGAYESDPRDATVHTSAFRVAAVFSRVD